MYSSGSKQSKSPCVHAVCTNGIWSYFRVQCNSRTPASAHCFKISTECCSICFDLPLQHNVHTHYSLGNTLGERSGKPTDCKVLGGKLYSDVWRPGDCVVCQCVNGVALCGRPQCTEISCRNPLKVKGECCPFCDSYGAVYESAVEPAGCRYQGTRYAVGESWNHNCQVCHCGKDLLVHCQDIVCSFHNCRSTARLQTQDRYCLACLGMLYMCK